MCAAPTQQATTTPAGVDVDKETVIVGRVVDDSGQPVGGAFVRLLDASDEFTAEVVASRTGEFRVFASPGSWTVRARSSIIGSGDAVIAPRGPGYPSGGHQNHYLDRWLLVRNLPAAQPASRGCSQRAVPTLLACAHPVRTSATD